MKYNGFYYFASLLHWYEIRHCRASHTMNRKHGAWNICIDIDNYCSKFFIKCDASRYIFRALYRNRQKSWTNSKDCKKSYGLSSEQLKICQQHLDLMSTVSLASYQGIDACQKQFIDRRWNCSSITSTPKLTKDLKRGNVVYLSLYSCLKLLLLLLLLFSTLS